MTSYEYALFVLEERGRQDQSCEIDEVAAFEVAQLVSGSFIFPLCESLLVNGFDMDGITDHLEYLYDSGNHYGLLYFVFILANAVDFIVPLRFSEMSARDEFVPIMSAAIIEDWVDYAMTFNDEEEY